MLVPTTQSTFTRISSSTLSTPTCAAPRAPPPESTRHTLGRAPAGAVPAGVVCAKTHTLHPKRPAPRPRHSHRGRPPRLRLGFDAGLGRRGGADGVGMVGRLGA